MYVFVLLTQRDKPASYMRAMRGDKFCIRIHDMVDEEGHCYSSDISISELDDILKKNTKPHEPQKFGTLETCSHQKITKILKVKDLMSIITLTQKEIYTYMSKERRQAGRAAWPRRAFGFHVQSFFPYNKFLPTLCHIVKGQQRQIRIWQRPILHHRPSQIPKLVDLL
uniref:Uncharacterized protein n=1 Tax=Glossina brevipalpis TaxID=37001 RepID=A0A1A9WJA4_9MUSC